MQQKTLEQRPEGQKTGLLINRNYTFLFVGQLISLIGDQVFDITVSLWIALVLLRGQQAAPLAVSGALVAAYIPVFLVGPIAGVFVDRWDKRKTLLRMDLIRFILIALLIPLTLHIQFIDIISIPTKLAIIYTLVFISNCCGQFFNPSRFALIGDVVAEKERAQAAGFGQASLALSIIIGPALAAPLFVLSGPTWALGINSASFLISFLAIAFVRFRSVGHTPSEATFRQEFREGIAYLLANSLLRTMLLAAFIAIIGIGTFDALFVFYISNTLHASTATIGILPASVGIGVLVGAILASVSGKVVGFMRLAKIAIWLSGVIFILLGVQTTFWVACVLAGLLGMMQSCLNVPLGPILLSVTPRHLIGRIEGLLNPTIVLGQVIGVVAAGILASTTLVSVHFALGGIHVGHIGLIFIGAGVLICAAAFYATLTLREPPTSTVTNA